jgi:hypothetical protein
MNSKTQKEGLPLRRLFCNFFGHRLIVKRNVTSHFREYECSICQLELTNNDKGEKTFLTPHLKEVNETLFNFYNRKHPLA